MGMAASQARYLALTARKTNVEYEGQQINQARTSLANQSATYFNQMLNMKVPTPPSIRDYTTIQYSFSDGCNTEVLSNYYQIGTADTDYNYVVTTYHNENVFTGSKKRLNDPQIQATIINNYSFDPTDRDQQREMIVDKAWFEASDGTYGIETSDGSTSIFRAVTEKEKEQVEAIYAGLGTEPIITETIIDETIDLTDRAIYRDLTDCDADDSEIIAKLFGVDITDAAFDPSNYGKTPDGQYIDKTDAANYDTTATPPDYTMNTAAAVKRLEVTREERPTGINMVEELDANGNPVLDKDGNPVMVASTEQEYYTDGSTFVTKSDLDAAVEKYNKYVETGYREKNNVTYITPQNDRTCQNYVAVGNCRLTELNSGDLADPDVAASIDQIIKDMLKTDQVASENLKACFEILEDGSAKYIGGLYTFKMGGQVYYTTERDLAASTPTSIVDNDIDVQQKKLSYYQATYLDTKVEETQKALLETDGKGRFKSMKLEDDSVVYTLNAEEITDEASYNDAMNAYYYQNALYEQTLQEINSKTEIIQAQDRTLELRLEQLNTEQSALQNEMEAVKKVIDKHVELGFKTFGG